MRWRFSGPRGLAPAPGRRPPRLNFFVPITYGLTVILTLPVNDVAEQPFPVLGKDS